jgi:hypothetical protein
VRHPRRGEEDAGRGQGQQGGDAARPPLQQRPRDAQGAEIFRSGRWAGAARADYIDRTNSFPGGSSTPTTPSRSGRRTPPRRSTGSGSSRLARTPTGPSIPSASSPGGATGTTAPGSPATSSATCGTRSTW